MQLPIGRLNPQAGLDAVTIQHRVGGPLCQSGIFSRGDGEPLLYPQGFESSGIGENKIREFVPGDRWCPAIVVESPVGKGGFCGLLRQVQQHPSGGFGRSGASLLIMHDGEGLFFMGETQHGF